IKWKIGKEKERLYLQAAMCQGSKLCIMRHTLTQNFLQERFFPSSSSKLMKASSTQVASKFNKGSGRGSLSRFKLLATSWSKNSMPMLGNQIKRKQYTCTSMVRGKDISLAPSNIKRVLKLRKDPIP
ncbi:hypothetical protein PIB30_108683, partial [Stylosanthes scabra]|nr:hypothetical protein [Stylosanthes scabra]